MGLSEPVSYTHLNSSSLAGVQLFHVSITPGRGGVISVLIIAYVAVLLEKQLQKVIPDFLDMFLRPLITVCVMTLSLIHI